MYKKTKLEISVEDMVGEPFIKNDLIPYNQCQRN